MAVPPPVILRIRRRKSALLGLALLPLVFIAGGFAALLITLDRPNLWLIGISTLTAFAFAAMAVFFLGIAWRNPAALRMDAKGISGFYVSPATWEEIESVGTFTDTHQTLNGNAVSARFLGFRLHDPIAFRARQTAWGRFKSWSSGRSSGYHLIVPESLMAGANAQDLAQAAQQFLIHRDR